MQSAVLQYLEGLSVDSRARVSKHFDQEVREFAYLSAKLVATLQRFHAHHPSQDADNARQVAFQLMTRGANTLMAGFELVLTGYMGESEVLLRGALERFAVAWDLVHNPDRFAAWKVDKKFDSTDSISRLKKEVEPVGNLYGYLSNLHVHITPKNSSSSMFLVEGDPKFQFFGYLSPGKEHLPKGQIYFSLFLAYVLLQLTEVVFHAYCDGFETIEQIPSEDLVRNVISERHRKFVDIGLEHFKLMAEDPLATLV
jgi:hypothetical protein